MCTFNERKKMLRCIFKTSVCRPDWMNAIGVDCKYCRMQGRFPPTHPPTAVEECLNLFQLVVWQITNKCRWVTEIGNIEAKDDYAAGTRDYFACLTNKVQWLIRLVCIFWAYFPIWVLKEENEMLYEKCWSVQLLAWDANVAERSARINRLC